MAAKRCFPNDCAGCPHFDSFDMSIDDWTNCCDVLNVQVDDCDLDYFFPIICPLDIQEAQDEPKV